MSNPGTVEKINHGVQARCPMPLGRMTHSAVVIEIDYIDHEGRKGHKGNS